MHRRLKRYINKELMHFQHNQPTKPEHSPHQYIEPQAPMHYTEPSNTTEPLIKAETQELMIVIGTFLYYARTIYSTILVALSSLALAQVHGTQATTEACIKLLNYAATHPDATIRNTNPVT
jgi:hypothetical protein